MAFKTGKYKPKNPEKYLGDIKNIDYRSSWELHVFEVLDNNPNVIGWASEEIAIQYLKPLPNGDFKKANYYPDIYVEYFNKDGKFIREIMEIKPLKQTKPSKSKKSKIKLFENYTVAVNMAKWNAAREWCKAHSIEFKIYTENSVYGGQKPTN